MNETVFSTAWELLRKHFPARLHRDQQCLPLNEIDEEQIEILPLLKKTSQQKSDSVERPHQWTVQVFECLDQASLEGLTTYKDLIDYVSQKTGKGCSTTLISKWKKKTRIGG